MQFKIVALPGDGIGPEVTEQAVQVLRAVASIYGHTFAFEEHPVGGAAIRLTAAPLPPNTLDACARADAVLLGAIGVPEFDQLPSREKPEAGLLQLRHALGGFANLRPVKCYSALSSASPLRPEVVDGADILFVRELLGGLYFGQPRGIVSQNGSRAAFNTMRYSESEIERVARVSYDAGERGILELLDAYRTGSAARVRQASLDLAVRQAEVELEFLSGWEMP